MRITKTFGMAAAGLAAIVATPAVAATYNLGALPANTLLSIHHPLSPTNLSDTINFSLPSFGQVRFNLFGRVPNAVVTFYRVGRSGALPIDFAFRGSKKSPNLPYFLGNTGNFYAVVTGLPTNRVSYNLRLTYNPAPVPGPAGLLVFGAGAAALVARRRRAKAKAAA
jgi:hypothetical protein